MSRRIDIDPEGRLLSITFPYNRELLDVVRALPERRFDHQLKAWFVPAQHVEQVVLRLHPLQFELTEAVVAFCQAQGASLDAVLARAPLANRPVIDLEAMPEGTWSVAMLNEQVRTVLHDAFREELWIAGELQGYDRNRPQGHAFFELVHRPFLGAHPTAQVSAVLWQDERALIERALIEDGAQVRLRDGLIARFLVKLDLYTGQGRYQLTVRDMDLAYTSGTLQQQRERILRELEQRQLAELNLLLPWPVCPMRLGLITSDGSDAYADFVHELGLSGLGFQVDLYPVQVQGANAEASVLRALRYFERHAHRYDALAIVRGGGARSDLAYFDTLAIGQAVCRHPLKIVVGIGHQRDVCLLDFIAASEKTPTAAAQHFVDRARGYLEVLRSLQTRVLATSLTQLQEARDQTERVALLTERAARHILDGHARRLTRQGYGITRSATVALSRATARLERHARELPDHALGRLALEQDRHLRHLARLEPDRLVRGLNRQLVALGRQRQRLERVSVQPTLAAQRLATHHQQRLRLLDPRRVLERGYALVRQDGLLVRDALRVRPELPLRVTLASGELDVMWLDPERALASAQTPGSPQPTPTTEHDDDDR